MTGATLVAQPWQASVAGSGRRWRLLFGMTLFCCVTLVIDIAPDHPCVASPGASRAFPAEAADDMRLAIVNDLRLPMALMALVVGCALVPGERKFRRFSTIRWPVPIHSGSPPLQVGAAISIFTGRLRPASRNVPCRSRIVFAMLASAFLFLLAGFAKHNLDHARAAGIALSLFQSLLSLLQIHRLAGSRQQILFGCSGSLTKTTWTNLWVTLA